MFCLTSDMFTFPLASAHKLGSWKKWIHAFSLVPRLPDLSTHAQVKKKAERGLGMKLTYIKTEHSSYIIHIQWHSQGIAEYAPPT